MADALLILNAGSSSLKFAAFDASERLDLLLSGRIESLSTAPRFQAHDASGERLSEKQWGRGEALDHAAAAEFALAWLAREGMRDRRLVGAGHRVVHGGQRFTRPARIDAATLAELRSLSEIAPLHQPQSLAAIDAVREAHPDLPQVACFDTSFHRTQPAVAQRYAIPRRFTDAGVRGYGFHGLSYESIAGALREVDASAAAGRTIVAHLGAGASMCAMRDGRSVATTMGFTALDGLVMATRCGSIDPGVLLHLSRRERLGPDEIESLLYERSGLLGVSGVSGDMRTLLASDDPRAKDAVDLFVYRAARAIGSLAAALKGLDALVFTGGIGEHAAPVRAAVCRACAWLGVDLDEPANERGGPRISVPGARVGAWVIPTDEALMIARHTARELGLRGGERDVDATARRDGAGVARRR